jgi:D-alanyl-D-alanine carboxypeptidase/D-alanyl-D-alanine-endopeptidase (penicillin-binding protein 4)
MKLPVAAAALHLLGPDHRFVTELRGAGRLDAASGVLDGDLVLPAAGDPTLSTRFRGSPTAALEALADSLRSAGVREVTGRLVVDASGWDSATAVPSWMVEDLPDAATGGAFVLEEGVTTVTVEGTGAGQPARVSWAPYGESTFVESRVLTAATPAEAAADPPRAGYHPESRRLVIEGRVAPGGSATLRLGTRDPVRQATAALARALEARGVVLREGWAVAWSRGDSLAGGCSSGELDACAAPALARITSPPHANVVEVILGRTNNWTAEQVVRALGRVDAPADTAGAAPSRPLAGWSTGLATVRRYLVETAGVDTLDFRLRDGSGLSAQNVLTPRAIVQILAHARSAPWGEAFRSALAEPGEAGTTLAARLEGLEGRVWGKTGTLTNVAALSGYLRGPAGEVIVFSILTNGSGLPASRVQAGIDQVVRALSATFR